MPPGYSTYLRSDAWRRIRRRRLELDGRRCATCGHDGSVWPLQMHHVSYERFGHEELGDLLTLCSSCHQAVTEAARRRRAVPRAVVFEEVAA